MEADPPWSATLLRYLLPLCALPALAWPLGQAWSGELPWAAAKLAPAFFGTATAALVSIVVLAGAFYLLAPFFDADRTWRRALAVAAYGSTPVLLTGALLVSPVLIVACVASLVHCCALYYLGVQALLGCRESDAAFFCAAAAMLSIVGGLVAAGLCSAAGLI